MASRQSSKVPGAAEFVPPTRSLAVLAEAVQGCRGCDLYRNATQAVFGQTGSSAKKPRLMMVGEQPGDREDREGVPFVGPAGRLLDQCLEEAGIDRREVYVTNTVKHFKWEPRGKVRLHKKPSAGEIFACRPWLQAEIEMIEPELLVALGATAAQAILGAQFRVTQSHGEVMRAEGWPPVLATAHPASILRAPRDEDRHRQAAELVQDLRNAKKFLRK
ncbi:UdgX family uracil-DNA binding protein [Acidobacteria bacterium AB60]|nr:UdgX family uracil-DNA binding protein [Acidobacteria bacterium AB60]